MNPHRQKQRTEAEQRLESMALDAVMCSPKKRYDFIVQEVDPAITDYEKKFGLTGFIRHYAVSMFKGFAEENE